MKKIEFIRTGDLLSALLVANIFNATCRFEMIRAFETCVDIVQQVLDQVETCVESGNSTEAIAVRR